MASLPIHRTTNEISRSYCFIKPIVPKRRWSTSLPQSSQSLPNPIIIPQSTAGNAGLEKEQLTLFVEKPQIIITLRSLAPHAVALSQRLSDGNGPHAGAQRERLAIGSLSG